MVKIHWESGLSASQRKKRGKRMEVGEEEEEEEGAKKEGRRDRWREIDRKRPRGTMMRWHCLHCRCRFHFRFRFHYRVQSSWATRDWRSERL